MPLHEETNKMERRYQEVSNNLLRKNQSLGTTHLHHDKK